MIVYRDCFQKVSEGNEPRHVLHSGQGKDFFVAPNSWGCISPYLGSYSALMKFCSCDLSTTNTKPGPTMS